MACGLPRKSEKDRKAWSSRGAKGERCTKEGGSIRAGPRAQEKALAQPSPLFYLKTMGQGAISGWICGMPDITRYCRPFPSAPHCVRSPFPRLHHPLLPRAERIARPKAWPLLIGPREPPDRAGQSEALSQGMGPHVWALVQS